MSDDPSSAASASESQALAEGQRLFGKYLLRRFLGRGPLGTAWLVMDESIGREMAMRFLPGGWFRDDRIKDALQVALGRWRELAHPHIVTAQNVVSDGVHAAIVTRFVEAETLQDLKSQEEERCFSVSRIVPWMAQLCDALDYALRHHQLVHGDLNPLNLLISKDDLLRVADFGLASSLFNLKGPDGSPVLVGTLAYISPERARGAEVTVSDDVYAFGATVYDSLTGKPPFFRGNILWQLESLVPPSMTERRTELGLGGEAIPPEWEEVVAACLAKQASDRPKSIREVGERLDLLPPMPATEAVTPMLFPRPSEEYTPQPRKPTEHVEIYPSSMPTAGMEAMTMAGIPNPPDDVCEGREVPGEAPESASPQSTGETATAKPSDGDVPGEEAAAPSAKEPESSKSVVPISAEAETPPQAATSAEPAPVPVDSPKQEREMPAAQLESTLVGGAVDDEPMTISLKSSSPVVKSTVDQTTLDQTPDQPLEAEYAEKAVPVGKSESAKEEAFAADPGDYPTLLSLRPEVSPPAPISAPEPSVSSEGQSSANPPAEIASPKSEPEAVPPLATASTSPEGPVLATPPPQSASPADPPAGPPLSKSELPASLPPPPPTPASAPPAGLPSASPSPAAPPPSTPPPELVQPVAAPAPSVVAIPPMDPSLERTLPQYPVAGVVALPSAPVPPAAVADAAPPPRPTAPTPPVLTAAAPPPPLPVQPSAPAASAPPQLPSAPPKAPPPPESAPPKPTPAAPPPIPAPAPASPAPPKSAPSIEDTDLQVTSAPAKRTPTVSKPAAQSDFATSVPATPQSPRRSNLPLIAAAAVVVLLAIGGGVMLTKKFYNGGNQTDPIPIAERGPVPVVPPVKPPVVPDPVLPGGRSLELSRVAELAGKGRPPEKLLLVGDLKVISAVPPAPGKPPSAVLRPADAALYGTMRVVANFSSGVALPQEGNVIRWTEADRHVVRDVVRGGDGQITVTTEPDRP